MANHSRIACALAIALAAVLAAHAHAADRLAGPVEARLERVIDGDTFAVKAHIWLDQELGVNVRLADVDAPELFRPACEAEREAAAEAQALIEALVAEETANGALVLTDIAYGKYAGRVVATVRTAAGRDVSALLLEAGLAAPMDSPRDWCAAPAERF